MTKVRVLAVTILLLLFATLVAQAQVTVHLPSVKNAFIVIVAQVQGGTLVVASGQVVTLSADMTVAGITVDAGGELRFDSDKSVTINSTGNVLVYGKLTLRPANPAIVHTLRFVGINESNFVGGGMIPLASDVGLWVMDSGQLDIAGAAKTAWTHAAGSIAQGATQVTVLDATGWQVGDEISITPTEAPSVGSGSWNGFDLRAITAINGNAITLSSGTTRAHPIATNPFDGAIYPAEVLNLTRNVRIEGTGGGNAPLSGNGRSHIFIHSTQPQSITYAAIRYMGPRMPDGSYTKFVLGRYGLHFHMMEDGSRGSQVTGVVIRDTGSHAFVPHASNGIAFDNIISYNTIEEAFWWDPPCTGCPDVAVNDSDDITVTHAVVAIVRVDPAFRGTRLGGFTLGKGQDNSLLLTDSIAVGVQGNKDASGFQWPENPSGIWLFTDNVAHNNKVDGLFVWQNNKNAHVIQNYIAYNNGEAGIDHGSYGNAYQYIDIDSFGNGDVDVRSRASSRANSRPDGYGHVWERVRMTGLFEIAEHNLPYIAPTLVRDCVIGGVFVDEHAKKTPGKYDFVNCVKPNGASLEPSDFTYIFVWPKSVYRVQRADGTAYQITGGSAVTTIAPFYVED